MDLVLYEVVNRVLNFMGFKALVFVSGVLETPKGFLRFQNINVYCQNVTTPKGFQGINAYPREL